MRESRYLTSRSKTKFFFDCAEIRPFRSRKRFWAEHRQQQVVVSTPPSFHQIRVGETVCRHRHCRWQLNAKSFERTRTSRELILYLHVLLSRHAEEMTDAVAISVAICEAPTRHGARGAGLVVVCRHCCDVEAPGKDGGTSEFSEGGITKRKGEKGQVKDRLWMIA